MKSYKTYQIIGYIFILFTLLTSCEIENGIEGDGVVTTERYPVQEFNKLKIDGVLNVYYSPAEHYKVEVKTDKNLQEIVKVENDGETLSIYTKSGEDFEATEMNIYVFAPTVSSIELDGVTALYVKTPIRQNALIIDKSNTGYMFLMGAFKYLTIRSDGVGDMELEGKSDNVIIDNEMIGNIFAYKFIAENMNLSHGGTGTVEIYVNSKLDIDLHGVGDVYCKGNPDNIQKTGDGNGRLYMKEQDR